MIDRGLDDNNMIGMFDINCFFVVFNWSWSLKLISFINNKILNVVYFDYVYNFNIKFK